jgi:predicted RNA-binding protein YlxR (DUF448 family)
MVRVTRAPDGTLRVGRDQPGRGAWICPGSLDCLAQAVRRGAFGRALRAEVAPGSVEALAGLLEPGDPAGEGRRP